METSTYEQQAIDFLAETQTTFTSEFKEFGSMPFDQDGRKRNIFTITLKNGKHAYYFCFGSSLADSCKEIKTAKIFNNGSTEIYYGFRHGQNSDRPMFGVKFKTTFEDLRLIDKGEKDQEEIIDQDAVNKACEEYQQSIRAFNTKMSKQLRRADQISGVRVDEIYAHIRKRINDTIKELKEETETDLSQQADTIIHPSAYDVLTCLTKYDPGTFENFCSEFEYDTDSRKAVRTYKAVRKEWNAVSKLFSESEIEALQEIQ